MSVRQPVYLTAEGVENLRRELDQLINVKRPALAERLRKAIRQGDISENADYEVAKEEQAFLEGRIQQIETMLRKAVIIQEHGPTDQVALGSRVTVVEEDVGGPETFQVVGPAEADPASGKVSNESPVGQALLGRRVGDTVTVEAPRGKIVFRITAIQ
jgi:transcription elongation factor GreA